MTPLEVPTLAYPGTPQAPLRGFFMPHDTWVKSYRKFREWEWYKTPGMFHLFHHLIYGANHKDNKWQGMEIKRGQIVTGRDKLSQQTGLSPRQIRTCLHRLQESQELTIKTTNRFSIITICNYDKYQVAESDSDQQSDQQATSKRPASDHKQELKNDKNGKNKEIYSVSFLKFWDFYLGKNKGSKLTAFTEWNKNGHPEVESLIEMHRKQGDQKRELKENGEFCPEWPHVSTYLNQARWEETFEREKGSDTGNAKTFLEYLDDQGNYVGPED